MATDKKNIRISKKQLDSVRNRAKMDARAMEPRELDAEAYVSSLTKMLTFYGMQFDNKSKKEWAVEYFKESDKELSKSLNKISHQYFGTLGSLIRMKENGVELINDSIDSRIIRLAREVSTKTNDEPSIPTTPRIKEEDTFLGEFEGYCDDYLGKKKSLGIVGWVRQHTPTLTQINALKGLIGRKASQYASLIEDKELLQAYRLTKKACSDIVSALNTAINELSSIFQRKVRTPKAVPVSKLVEKVQYLQKDAQLDLTSIDPCDMIGKTALVTFNKKTKKVQYYVASEGKTLSVKGTTLLNFDTEKSVQKLLRNPKDQLINMLQLPKKAFEKALGLVRSIDTEPTGRLNTDTILCKTL